MEIKNILSKLGSNKEIKKELFLALEISSEVVKSAVWTVENKKTAVLKIGSTEEWDERNLDSLISAADVSISTSSEGLGDPNKVILGLPETWVKGDQISDSKKEILKKLCSKLELKPLGFVVTLEAIITFLKEKEGTPITAIFINIGETQSIISLVVLGKVKGSHVVGRSNDLASDVKEGLVRFGEVGNLPSRMVLFNGITDFEEAKQQLTSFDWQKELPFLHFPKVRSLESHTSIRAIALAGGAEVAKSLGFDIEEVVPEAKEPPPKIPEGQMKEVDASSLGFVFDKDIAEIKMTKPEKIQENKFEEELRIEAKKEELITTSQKSESKKPTNFFRGLLFNFLNIKQKLVDNFPHPSFNRIPSMIAFVFILFFLFIIAGFAFYWYVPKATVAIYLKPKVLEKELDVTLDTNAQIDSNNSVVPGLIKSVEVEGDKSKNTTGQKLVGDKAKGTITVYNKTSVSKTFPKGTVLVGTDQLSFILDQDTTIASKSAQAKDEGEQVVYGKASAAVTASAIGTQYNLAAQTPLSLREYSANQYSAKVENGLSGGTSREIKAVGKDDLAVLLNDLTKELSLKGKDQLKNQLASGEEVLDKELKTEVENKKYSADENDEADEVKLNLKLKINYLVYKKEDLNKLIELKFKDLIPNNYLYDKNVFEISVADLKLTDGKASLKSIVKSKLLPKVNSEEIKKRIVGRYPDAIQDYLKTLPDFSRADINISPKLPAKLQTLPRIPTNINLQIKTED